jgi:hypothetical protein
MRNCEAQLSCKCVKGKRCSKSKPEFKLKGNVVFPRGTPETMEDLRAEKVSYIKLEGTLYNKKIFTSHIMASRSEEQQDMLENNKYHMRYRNKDTREANMDLLSPLSQYDLMVKTSTLTHYEVDTTYKPENLEKTCGEWCPYYVNLGYRYLKHWYFENSEVRQINVDNEKDVIRATIKLDPVSFQVVDVNATMPRETITVTDAPLPFPVYPMNLRRRSVLSRVFGLRETYYPKCIVKGASRITTFDGHEYRAPLDATSCYTVLAKDCSNEEEPRYAVLKRVVKDKDEKKTDLSEIKIVSDDCEKPVMIKLEPGVKEATVFKVKIGEKTETPTPYTSMKVSSCVVERENRVVRVVLKKSGVIVRFDGYTTEIMVSPMYSSMQCGICGDYDGESYDESEFRRLRHMESIYQDGKCWSESDEKMLEDEEIFSPESSMLESDEYDSAEADMDMPYDSRSESVERYDPNESSMTESSELSQETMKGVEATRCEHSDDGTFCFSTKPIKTCPSGYVASEMETKVKAVKFVCLRPNDYLYNTISAKCSDVRSSKIKISPKKLASMVKMWKKESEDMLEVEKDVKIKVTVPMTCEEY